MTAMTLSQSLNKLLPNSAHPLKRDLDKEMAFIKQGPSSPKGSVTSLSNSLQNSINNTKGSVLSNTRNSQD